MPSVRNHRLSVFIEGTPKPKQRPRWSGKFMYSPKTEWEKILTNYFESCDDYYYNALQVSMIFYMPRPKKHYRTGKFSHVLKDDSPYWHTNKPDRDNLEKAVLDCMTKGGILKDDCIVCTGSIEKKWANDKSGVFIKIDEVQLDK